MPDLNYFVVASSFAVDQSTNRVTIFEALDEITPVKLPAIVTTAAVVMSWRIEEGVRGMDLQALLKITNSDGEKKEFAINFTPKTDTHRTLYRIGGWPLQKPGIILIEVYLNGEIKAKTQIFVREPDKNKNDNGSLIYPEDHVE